jgi:hypothetical protein
MANMVVLVAKLAIKENSSYKAPVVNHALFCSVDLIQHLTPTQHHYKSSRESLQWEPRCFFEVYGETC